MKNHQLIATLQVLPTDADIWLEAADHEGNAVTDRAVVVRRCHELSTNTYSIVGDNLIRFQNSAGYDVLIPPGAAFEDLTETQLRQIHEDWRKIPKC